MDPYWPRAQPLMRSSSRRNKFIFFAGRKKSTPIRTGSVRRNPSHRRVPSTSVRQRTGRDGSVSKPQGQRLCLEIPAEAGSDKTLSVSNRSAQGSPSAQVQIISRTNMPKDAELPPLPPEAYQTQGEQPEAHKATPGLFKRFTTKLRSTSGSHHHALSTPGEGEASGSSSQPPHKQRKASLALPKMPKGPTPALTNAFTSPEQRQAALRERGLIPAVPHPYKDSHGYMLPLSEQEKFLDKKFAVVVEDDRRSSVEEERDSEAKGIREAWLKKNHEDQNTASTSSATPVEEESNRKDSMSASERASALAVPEDNIVIGKQPSPRRGTFVGKHSPLPLSPISVDLRQNKEPHNIPFSESPLLAIDPETTASLNQAETSSSPTSEASEKVTRWLQSTPTGSSFKTAEPGSPHSAKSATSVKSAKSTRKADADSVIDQGSTIRKEKADIRSPSPTAPSTTNVRKEKPCPITVQSPSSFAALVAEKSNSAPSTAIPPQSPPVDFEDPRSPRQANLPTLSVSPPPAAPRGRSMTVAIPRTTPSLNPISLAPSTSTGSDSRSRSKVPALSPTRTASSSAASEAPPTPTTTSPSRERKSLVSVASHSSDGRCAKRIPPSKSSASHGLRIETTTVEEQDGEVKLATVIVDSPIEENVATEFGKRVLVSEGPGFESSEKMPTPRSRPVRPNTEVHQERRKSITFGLFSHGLKSHSLNVAGNEKSSQPKPHASRSMSNLRRSVAGTLSSKLHLRPKSSLVVDTANLNQRATPSPTFDASHLPTSPTWSPAPMSPPPPPSSYRAPEQTSDTFLRPRPRQPLSPTIHSRGSILMETKGIEDDESRRLSELAFLDF